MTAHTRALEKAAAICHKWEYSEAERCPETEQIAMNCAAEIISAYLTALASDAEVVERVARAICAADPYAPESEAPIMIGLKNAKAWEAREPQARATLTALAEMGRE